MSRGAEVGLDGEEPVPCEERAKRLDRDPRLRRIERDHAIAGALLIAGGWFRGSWRTSASVALGWAILAASLWMWKRIASRALGGGDQGGAGMAARVLAKMTVTFGGVYAAVRMVDVEVLPFVVGTFAFPVACVIEALRGPDSETAEPA